MKITSYTLLDMFPSESSFDVLKEKWSDVDQTNLLYFCNWFDEFVLSKYIDCTYYRSVEDDIKGAFKRLRRYYIGHIDIMIQVKDWFEENQAKMVNDTVKSTSISKNTSTPQDGASYVDTYPNSINKTEMENGSKTPLDNLNALLKKYKDYRYYWSTEFVREEQLKYED